MVIFNLKAGPDIETPNGLMGKTNGRGHVPPQSTSRSGERRTSQSWSGAEPRPKMITILVYFIRENPPLVNIILLKCC